QKELGEEEERDDVEEMRQRIEQLELGEEQRAEVERELRQLERTSPQSGEYQVIRTFLEWVTELPWQERSEEKIDLARAEQILEEDHHGLEDGKDRILEFLSVRKRHLARTAADADEAAGAGKAGPRPRRRRDAAVDPASGTGG